MRKREGCASLTRWASRVSSNRPRSVPIAPLRRSSCRTIAQPSRNKPAGSSGPRRRRWWRAPASSLPRHGGGLRPGGRAERRGAPSSSGRPWPTTADRTCSRPTSSRSAKPNRGARHPTPYDQAGALSRRTAKHDRSDRRAPRVHSVRLAAVYAPRAPVRPDRSPRTGPGRELLRLTVSIPPRWHKTDTLLGANGLAPRPRIPRFQTIYASCTRNASQRKKSQGPRPLARASGSRRRRGRIRPLGLAHRSWRRGLLGRRASRGPSPVREAI